MDGENPGPFMNVEPTGIVMRGVPLNFPLCFRVIATSQ